MGNGVKLAKDDVIDRINYYDGIMNSNEFGELCEDLMDYLTDVLNELDNECEDFV